MWIPETWAKAQWAVYNPTSMHVSSAVSHQFTPSWFLGSEVKNRATVVLLCLMDDEKQDVSGGL